MFFEELRDGQGVFAVPLHPQVQRFQPQERQERTERTLAGRPVSRSQWVRIWRM